MVRFAAKIYKIGMNPVVDPPEKALQEVFVESGTSSGPIPVRGKLNGADFVQTLVKYKGAWRLYINGPMLKDSGLAVGDTAKIELEFDQRPREVPMPEPFAQALAREVDAKSVYEALPPSRKKEILKYLNSLKSETSVLRNVERAMRRLRGEETDSQHGLRRRKK